VKTLKTELARAKHSLKNSEREREEAVDAIRSEMQSASILHEKEITNLQRTVDIAESKLTAANERLASEDRELERAKATLSERTNLLRDMVNQTTAYQGDYEREHNRANQFDEAMKSYKKQLADARDVAQRLEDELHDKDTHYCGAIQNERQQRKAIESELESSQIAKEDALRQKAEMEKENSALRDKVSRQEKYIGRLQDREKQNRRVMSTASAATSQGNQRGLQSKMTRPSTAGESRSRSPMRNTKGRVPSTKSRGAFYATDENVRPNIGRFGLARPQLPKSPDELDSLLG